MSFVRRYDNLSRCLLQSGNNSKRDIEVLQDYLARHPKYPVGYVVLGFSITSVGENWIRRSRPFEIAESISPSPCDPATPLGGVRSARGMGPKLKRRQNS